MHTSIHNKMAFSDSMSSVAGNSPILEPTIVPGVAPSSKRARLSGQAGFVANGYPQDGLHHSMDFDQHFSSQSGLNFIDAVEKARMDTSAGQGFIDFTRNWILENAIDSKSFDSLELDLSSPAYSIPFNLPYDLRPYPKDPKSPSLIGISFAYGESPSAPRNIDQQSAVDVPLISGLETPDSATFVDLGPPSMSTVNQEWEKGAGMWSQGWGEFGLVTPDSSSFGVDLNLPSSFAAGPVVGDGGSRKRDREEMERDQQSIYEEFTQQLPFEPQPPTISTADLIVESYVPPALLFKPYLKLVSPGKRKERQFRLGFDGDAVRMLREAQMAAMVQLATNGAVTPSIFPLSDLLLPLLDSSNRNVKARTELYYTLTGRSPPSPSSSTSELDFEMTSAQDDDEEEEDPRVLDLAWYKKEWFAMGYTEDALMQFGWVEEEE